MDKLKKEYLATIFLQMPNFGEVNNFKIIENKLYNFYENLNLKMINGRII